jgi:hypothetical protein
MRFAGDGKDEKGRALAGGIYFLRMQEGQSQQFCQAGVATIRKNFR